MNPLQLTMCARKHLLSRILERLACGVKLLLSHYWDSDPRYRKKTVRGFFVHWSTTKQCMASSSCCMLFDFRIFSHWSLPKSCSCYTPKTQPGAGVAKILLSGGTASCSTSKFIFSWFFWTFHGGPGAEICLLPRANFISEGTAIEGGTFSFPWRISGD